MKLLNLGRGAAAVAGFAMSAVNMLRTSAKALSSPSPGSNSDPASLALFRIDVHLGRQVEPVAPDVTPAAQERA